MGLQGNTLFFRKGRPLITPGAAGDAAVSYALIRQAIMEKKVVRAIHHGLYREMCPHVIGATNGEACALFYQFGGQSISHSIEPGHSMDNWRCINISELSEVTIEEGAWHTASYDSKLQSCIDELDAVVPR